MKTFLVAEIGLNHMGFKGYADDCLTAIAGSGFDAVEFQVREPAFYAKGADEHKLLLPDSYYRTAAQRMRLGGFKFGVALSDRHMMPFFESIGTDFYKVLSKDINDHALVRALLNTGKPVYVSTGTSGEEELRDFLSNLGSVIPPNLSFIHTQLSYDDADTNLRAIERMGEIFGTPVAFGSHSTCEEALYAAVSFAPTAIFAYVKGGQFPKHRDEKHALPLSHLSAVAATIRRLETMLGDGIKRGMENRIPDQRPARV